MHICSRERIRQNVCACKRHAFAVFAHVFMKCVCCVSLAALDSTCPECAISQIQHKQCAQQSRGDVALATDNIAATPRKSSANDNMGQSVSVHSHGSASPLEHYIVQTHKEYSRRVLDGVFIILK